MPNKTKPRRLIDSVSMILLGSIIGLTFGIFLEQVFFSTTEIPQVVIAITPTQQIHTQTPHVVTAATPTPVQTLAVKQQVLSKFERSDWTCHEEANGLTVAIGSPSSQVALCYNQKVHLYAPDIEDVYITYLAWSPNGKFFSFVSNGVIYRVDMSSETNDFISSFQPADFDPRNLRWTNDALSFWTGQRFIGVALENRFWNFANTDSRDLDGSTVVNYHDHEGIYPSDCTRTYEDVAIKFEGSEVTIFDLDSSTSRTINNGESIWLSSDADYCGGINPQRTHWYAYEDKADGRLSFFNIQGLKSYVFDDESIDEYSGVTWNSLFALP